LAVRRIERHLKEELKEDRIVGQLKKEFIVLVAVIRSWKER
jgi:hypothetical protein